MQRTARDRRQGLAKKEQTGIETREEGHADALGCRWLLGRAGMAPCETPGANVGQRDSITRAPWLSLLLSFAKGSALGN